VDLRELTNIDTKRKSGAGARRARGAARREREAARSTRDWLLESVSWAGGLLFVISLAVYLYAYLVRFGRPTAAGPIIQPVALDAGLFTLFAAHHSLFARIGLKRWVERNAPAELERSIYTWISSSLFLVVCLGWRPVPGVLYELHGWAAWPGYALQLAGILLIVLASASIDVLDLAGVRQVMDVHRGRPPRHVPLETGGVYVIVRHPIYFGWALFVLGAPHMTATRFVFAVISTAYLAVAVPWEERSLAAVFGDEYRAYQRRVRWRMLPGIY
jgi:protein-S-isoprenylcysteine O-methyltransferase Ste14